MPEASALISHVHLRFDVRGPDLAGDIVVYFRPLESPQGAVRSVRAKRDARSFVAVVPESAVSGAGIAYWVVERDPQGREQALFASMAQPQPLHVHASEDDSREARLLRLAGGRRSRMGARFEWVDMGGYKVADPEVPDDEHDRYLQADALYAYRFYRAVEELEVGLGYLDGRLLSENRRARRRVGLQYARTAVTFAFGDWFRLRPGAVLGFSTLGFAAGFDLALLFGDRDGTDFELGGGYVNDLGGHVRARLGWATVPRVPMGARVEITNYPNHDDFGVRLLFDIGYRFGSALLVRANVGYRGRTSLAGGPSLGLEAHYAF